MRRDDPQAHTWGNLCHGLAVNPQLSRRSRERLGRYADRLAKGNTSKRADLEAHADVDAALRLTPTLAPVPRSSPAPEQETPPPTRHVHPWLILTPFLILGIALLLGFFALDLALHRRADPALTIADWVFSRRQPPTRAATAEDTEMIEMVDWYVAMGGFARFIFNLGCLTVVLAGGAVSWFIGGWLIVSWENRHPREGLRRRKRRRLERLPGRGARSPGAPGSASSPVPDPARSPCAPLASREAAPGGSAVVGSPTTSGKTKDVNPPHGPHKGENYWASLAPHKAELLAHLPNIITVNGTSCLECRPIQYWLPGLAPWEKCAP